MDKLKQIKPTKPFLVCIDSDGCVFDSMELKHKECFIPATVNVWNLQAISRYVRETSEFVNLYSFMRGTNRFPALVKVFKLLKDRPEVIEREIYIPDLAPLEEWINTTLELSVNSLSIYIESNEEKHPILVQALEWSKEVDHNIKHIVRNVKPFPYVRESLKKISEVADIVIVSATPYDAIVREWNELELMDYLIGIGGQEQGTKGEIIQVLATKYDKENIIMLGDAMGDRRASDQNDVTFYPIIPGVEVKSWKEFYEIAFTEFTNKNYDNNNNKYYEMFTNKLLDKPNWELVKNLI